MNSVSLYIAFAVSTTVPAAVFAQELAADVAVPQAAIMAPAKPDPEAAAARISQALKGSTEVTASDITVSSHASIIVLNGKVNSEAERHAVVAIAEKTATGLRINNNIEVRAPEDVPVKEQRAAQQTTQLVHDVEAALKSDGRTANLGVAVTSSDGRIVVLQGLVSSSEQRTQVQDIASKVKGVARIDNRLIVP